MTSNMAVHVGRFVPTTKLRVGIVVSRFNEFITKRLLESAVQTLEQAGLSKESLEIVWVPGALEIAYFCKRLAESKHCDVVIALGCVIRGDTFHYDCVCHEATRSISQVSLESRIPIATALLTVDSLEQAIDRAGLKAGNKGQQAALAALELADLNRELNSSSSSRSSSLKENRRSL